MPVDERRERLIASVTVSPPLIGRAAAPTDRNDGQRQRSRIGEHVSGFGQERYRVRVVATSGLDHCEACENDERDDQPTLAGVTSVARAITTAVVIVMVMAVVPVRVRHELGTPASACILETL